MYSKIECRQPAVKTAKPLEVLTIEGDAVREQKFFAMLLVAINRRMLLLATATSVTKSAVAILVAISLPVKNSSLILKARWNQYQSN